MIYKILKLISLWYVPFKVVSSILVQSKVYSIQLYVIKFVSDMQQIGGFLLALCFPSPIKLTTTIYLKYYWKWRFNNITLTPCIGICWATVDNKSTRHGMCIGRQQEHTTWNVYRSTTRAHDMECVSVDNKSTRHGMCIGRQQEHTTWNVYHFRYVHSLDSVIF
jgi:predicted Fe-S protein YdhL (DUF1289 family)